MNPKICILTVTYGNRYHLVKTIIERALEEGASHCVIVDNGSVPESAQNLREFAQRNPRISLLQFQENLGSAGGYKVGLEKISQDIDCDYVLLLDDDNLLERGSLDKLRALTLYFKDFPHPYALLCQRDLFEVQNQFVYHGCDFSYKYNAFASANMIKNLTLKLKKLFPKKEAEHTFFPLSRIDGAPYGGFFFAKSILDLIGYPREDFFLYVDDLEYTYRLTAKGGYIFICSEVRIDDIDTSSNYRSKVFWLFQEELAPFRLYYYIRNATYWYFTTFRRNNILYILNMVLWFLRVLLGAMTNPKLFFERFPLILRAISDGHRGKLGKTL